MSAADVSTLTEVANLLDEEASILRDSHTVAGKWSDDDTEIHAAHDRMVRLARDLLRIATALPDWTPVPGKLPDADAEVMVALDDGDVIPAFYEDGCWRDLLAYPLSRAVLFWSDYPDHPMPPKGCPS